MDSTHIDGHCVGSLTAEEWVRDSRGESFRPHHEKLTPPCVLCCSNSGAGNEHGNLALFDFDGSQVCAARSFQTRVSLCSRGCCLGLSSEPSATQAVAILAVCPGISCTMQDIRWDHSRPLHPIVSLVLAATRRTAPRPLPPSFATFSACLGLQVSDKAGQDVMELFADLEEYIGEAIYSLAKQGTDQSMAETIRQFITTQVRSLATRCECDCVAGRP